MSIFSNRSTQYIVRMMYCVLLFLTACTPATPTYFIPPTAPSIYATKTISAIISTPTPSEANPNIIPATEEELPTTEVNLPSPTPPACTNSLSFVEDITVTDGTVLATGEAFIKQWRIKNDGTCDWDGNYKLKLISGNAMGSPDEIALYPAAAGAEAVIEINLITPAEAGPYHTVWQAYAPDGTPFEQAIYVDIVAQ